MKITGTTAGLVCKVRHYTFHYGALFSLFQRITQVAVAGVNKSAKRICAEGEGQGERKG
jgi:hypothetical protein